jgi:hypothetical protein
LWRIRRSCNYKSCSKLHILSPQIFWEFFSHLAIFPLLIQCWRFNFIWKLYGSGPTCQRLLLPLGPACRRMLGTSTPRADPTDGAAASPPRSTSQHHPVSVVLAGKLTAPPLWSLRAAAAHHSVFPRAGLRRVPPKPVIYSSIP